MFENHIITLAPTVLRKRQESESDSRDPCEGEQKVHSLLSVHNETGRCFCLKECIQNPSFTGVLVTHPTVTWARVPLCAKAGQTALGWTD